MSEENKTEKAEEKKDEPVRGDRGELGTATPRLTMLQKWREATHRRENPHDKNNENKRIYVRIEGTPSLKQFARALLKEGDPVAKRWFANKWGAANQKRSEANAKAAREAGAATKAKKREAAAKKRKGGGG